MFRSVLALGVCLAVAGVARAQVAGQQGQQGQQGTATQGQQGQQGNVGGILVDADGVVSAAFTRDKKLDAKRRAELAAKDLPPDLTASSPLRKVSLVKLEQVCETYAQKKEPVPAEMFFLAGLQRIEYVFVDPEGKDLVIAGPAEGFTVNSLGRATGVNSSRPVLRLDDLLVVLRTVNTGSGTIGCSIDPRQENLARLNSYLAQNSGAVTPDVAKSRFVRMREILGMQDVRVLGVPAESHFANMLVEADYRMKLLAMQLEPAPVKGFKSHLAMIAPGANAMQRFWFTPLYDAFLKSEDGLAYQIRGPRVQLLSEEELVAANGQRAGAAFTRISSNRFAKQFTDLFPQIADASPVFAELQNGIDLAVLGALIQKEGLAEKAGWTMTLFLDEQRAPIQTYNVPRKVHSAMNFKTGNSKLLIAMLGGGIDINPRTLARQVQFQPDDGVLKNPRKSAFETKAPAAHTWWWD